MSKRKKSKRMSKSRSDAILLGKAAREIRYPADKRPPQREMYAMLRKHGERRGFKPGWAAVIYRKLNGKYPAGDWKRDPVIAPNAWLMEQIAAIHAISSQEMGGSN